MAHTVKVAHYPGVTKDKDKDEDEDEARSTAEAKEEDEAQHVIVTKIAHEAGSVTVMIDKDRTKHLIVLIVAIVAIMAKEVNKIT